MKKFTHKDIKTLFPNMVNRLYPSGQIVLYQGDRPSHGFYIIKGSIKKYDIRQDGTESIIYVFTKGSIIPVHLIFDIKPEVTNFFATIEDCELGMIEMDEFKKEISVNKKLSNDILTWFVKENENLTKRLSAIIQADARKKLLSTLYLFTEIYCYKTITKWYKVRFPISHQMLADMVGLSRETVSTTLNQLEAEKLIKNNKYLKLEINKTAIEKALT